MSPDNPVLTSWLRTVVPALWSVAVAWAVSRIPLVGQFVNELNLLGNLVVVPVVLGAVYAALRWVEPKIPAWLTRVLLGSAKSPTYAPQNPDGSHRITRIENLT